MHGVAEHYSPVVVVIPTYRQPVFLVDAILSCLGQEISFPLQIVIIDDGCPMSETQEVCRAFSSCYSDRVTWIRQRNMGLSGARNTGIDFALNKWPALVAIFMLDSDNHIHHTFLERATRLLLMNPGKGWVYTDIDMFGMADSFDTGGDYSLLLHTRYSCCEAASLVHADVFRSGIRYRGELFYDEDWDFWLQAAMKGFRGSYLPAGGLNYRRRPQSMNMSRSRLGSSRLSLLMQRNLVLFKPSHLAQLEEEEAPRFCVFDDCTLMPHWTSNPSWGNDQTRVSDFVRRYHAHVAEPNHVHWPAYALFISQKLRGELIKRNMLEWIIWELERQVAGGGAAVLRLLPSDRLSIGPSPCTPEAATETFVVALLSRSQLASRSDAEAALKTASVVSVTLPLDLLTEEYDVVDCVLCAASEIESSPYCNSDSSVRWGWKQSWGNWRSISHSILRDALMGEVAISGIRGGACLSGPASFFESGAVQFFQDLIDCFDTVAIRSNAPVVVPSKFEAKRLVFLPEVVDNLSPRSKYLGADLPGGSNDWPETLGALFAFDSVAFIGPPPSVELVAHLHACDVSIDFITLPLTDTDSPLRVVLALEHVCRRYICADTASRDWLLGMGVPLEKIQSCWTSDSVVGRRQEQPMA